MSRRRRKRPSKHHGLLLIDKLKGESSFDIIRSLRRSTQEPKMGHTGTLDPMATGLMIICVGEGTKLVPYLTADDKRYIGEITFGVSTDTYDAEGEVLSTDSYERASQLTAGDLSEALLKLTGEIEQRPPAYSAIKVNGERLYEKARRGEAVEAPLRRVTLHALQLDSFISGTSSEFPKATLSVHCSKGTYIRSLALDLGKLVGLNAHLTQLRRTSCGVFNIDQACLAEEVDEESISTHLRPLVDALPHWPLIELSSTQEVALKHGQQIYFNEERRGPHSSPSRAINSTGRLIALIAPISNAEGLDSTPKTSQNESPLNQLNSTELVPYRVLRGFIYG
jgi:tRNA pseudouridine55 synthase